MTHDLLRRLQLPYVKGSAAAFVNAVYSETEREVIIKAAQLLGLQSGQFIAYTGFVIARDMLERPADYLIPRKKGVNDV